MPLPRADRTRREPGRPLSDAKRPRRPLERYRRHLALAIAVVGVSIFGLVIVQPRTVRVQADGRELVMETRHSNDAALLSRAGIDLGPGDRVTALEAVAADVLRVDRARTVRLIVDGVIYEMRTHAETIDQLLAENPSVTTDDRDSVLQNGALVSVNSPVEPPRLLLRDAGGERSPDGAITIEVRRAVPFTIREDGRELLSTSSRPTVAQALREAGVTLGPGDAVTPDAQAALSADIEIDIRHARAVTVALPEDHRVLYTLAGTVGDALDDAGISVPDGAYIDPPAGTPVTAGMSVRVVQLAAGSDVEREYMESATVYRSDPSLPPGQTRTVQGHDGVRVRRYAISYVNGEEVGRELVDEYYEQEPLDTVIYYPTPRGASEQPPDGSAVRTLRVYATWYNAASSGRSADDPAYGRTATGVIVTYGIVAVDPTVIPLGTRMFIPGYGYAVAADTGGAVKGYIIDLGYPDGVVSGWQSRWLDIYILS